MFRKPKSRNIRQRQTNFHEDDSDESPVKQAKEEPKAEQVRTDSFPKGVLSFNESEEDDIVSFKLKKDKTGIKTKKSHRLRKRVKSEVSEDEEDHKLHVKTEIIEEEEDIIIEEEIKPKKKNDPTRIPDEESYRYQAISQSTSAHSDDTRAKFSSLSTIPDEKMIYEARKRRQAMREGGQMEQQGALNLDEPLSLDKKASASRLVREDENDLSDEEQSGRFISSSNLLMDEEQKKRNEQLEALRMEQGSDDEEQKESDDEELQRWEQEQIKKAVSQKKITEFKTEYAATRRFNQGPATLQDMGMILDDEDMEIDQEGAHQMPAFFNPDGTYKVSHKYHSMADLIEQLEISRGKKLELLQMKKDEYENNQRNLKIDQESVFQLAESNGKLELYYKLYQEMKFFTDNVMDCLNEKVNEINEIDGLFMDLYKTRADDISRRRAEAKRRAKYNRNEEWNSENEESTETEALRENIAKFHQRASTIFADASAEYHDLNQIYRRFIDWLTQDPKTFQDAYIDECIPKLITPLVRMELFEWNPLLPNNPKISSMEWYKAVLRLGFDNTEIDVDHKVIIGLIPNIVEKILIPKLTKIVEHQYDPSSTTQTLRITSEINNLVNTFPSLNSKSRIFRKLLITLKEKAQGLTDFEMRIPEHLRGIVTTISRKNDHQQDDIAALLAASKSVMK
ncbi:unnamed protein product [Bursaphelenchus xylophilus]|uniref:(pine wood nematode) hypothetical protein n=1 Tax=Bursaphelenchus xylophilus TaxID=6326 RepID=A0A1I7S0R2_BURXY|nr:unnamed protein product [Bursaphelenchus xylophilus]CAG9088284.1 unnamed protein product [Bursaphelenchus xylophilus]